MGVGTAFYGLERLESFLEEAAAVVKMMALVLMASTFDLDPEG